MRPQQPNMSSEQQRVSEISSILNAVGTLFKKVDEANIDAQSNTTNLLKKLDEWILTNRLLLESDQQLLKAILENVQEVGKSTAISEKGLQLLNKFAEQLNSLEQLTNQLLSISSLPDSAPTMELQILVKEIVALKAALLKQGTTGNQTITVQSHPLANGLPILSEKEEITPMAMGWIGKILFPRLNFITPSLFLLCLGAVVGVMGSKVMSEPLAENQLRRLTASEVDTLRWSKTQEGRLARRLIDWNQERLVELDCIKDVERLGVTLKVSGREAEYGFCTIWVVPPSERRFVP
jgi:hypothetical protein